MTDAIDQLIKLSEGNPGAITVVRALRAFTDCDALFKKCSASKLTGSKLWVAYKNVCTYDIRTLQQMLGTPALADAVNHFVEQGECGKNVARVVALA